MKTRSLFLFSFLIFSLVTTSSSYAYNVYYQGNIADNTLSVGDLTALGILEEIGTEILTADDLYANTLPSRHEALVYRAIADICRDDFSNCWIIDVLGEDYGSLLESPEFSSCSDPDSVSSYIDYGFSDPFDPDYNCNVIGRDGLSDLPFKSLLMGARWVDLKGMPGLMAENKASC